MGIKARLRRLQRAADEELITFELRDGTVARFPERAFAEYLVYEWHRGRRHYDGENPGPAHPLVDALSNAKDLQTITREHGMMMAAFVDEDAVMRERIERRSRRDES